MTPLQTSSDPEVADWEKPLGAACFTRRIRGETGVVNLRSRRDAPEFGAVSAEGGGQESPPLDVDRNSRTGIDSI